ncbi:hypothetical protein HDV01_000718 [Terramyces sp. JEL0728]|nr:hypothetical protein HDV01_000718 [Terramyces sp. JEL0728]
MTLAKSSRLTEKRISELKEQFSESGAIQSLSWLTTNSVPRKKSSFFSSFASFGSSQRLPAQNVQPVQAPPTAEPVAVAPTPTDPTICSLCLDNLPQDYPLLMSASDPVKKLPCCNQHIHAECYLEYRTHGFTTCHLCRQPLTTFSSRFENEQQTIAHEAVSVTIQDPMTVSTVAEQDQSGNYNVVATIQAPSFSDHATGSERYGIDLVLVVDVSGSMSGSKIDMVIQSIKYLIQEELLPHDRIALVIFNGSARNVYNFTRVSSENKVGLVDATAASLVASDGTNIMDGVKNAINLLQSRSYKNPLASILLLSDGCDNYNTPPNAIVREAAEMGIAIQSFGYGTDHDSVYLEKISKLSCNGGFQYVESPQQIVPIFAGAISGLASLIAENVTVEISVPRESSFILDNVYCGSYKIEKKSSYATSINLLSLLEAETRLVIFTVENRNRDDLKNKLLVKVTYFIPGTTRSDTVQDYLETAGDFNVQFHEISCEAILTKEVAKAIALGDAGNYDAAKKTLEDAKKKIVEMKSMLVAKYPIQEFPSLDEYIIEISNLMPRFSQRQYNAGGRSATTEIVGNYGQQRMLNIETAYEGSNMTRWANVAAKKSKAKYSLFSK